jgi:hypothetical protein
MCTREINAPVCRSLAYIFTADQRTLGRFPPQFRLYARPRAIPLKCELSCCDRYALCHCDHNASLSEVPERETFGSLTLIASFQPEKIPLTQRITLKRIRAQLLLRSEQHRREWRVTSESRRQTATLPSMLLRSRSLANVASPCLSPVHGRDSTPRPPFRRLTRAARSRSPDPLRL